MGESVTAPTALRFVNTVQLLNVRKGELAAEVAQEAERARQQARLLVEEQQAEKEVRCSAPDGERRIRTYFGQQSSLSDSSGRCTLSFRTSRTCARGRRRLRSWWQSWRTTKLSQSSAKVR